MGWLKQKMQKRAQFGGNCVGSLRSRKSDLLLLLTYLDTQILTEKKVAKPETHLTTAVCLVSFISPDKVGGRFNGIIFTHHTMFD